MDVKNRNLQEMEVYRRRTPLRTRYRLEQMLHLDGKDPRMPSFYGTQMPRWPLLTADFGHRSVWETEYNCNRKRRRCISELPEKLLIARYILQWHYKLDLSNIRGSIILSRSRERTFSEIWYIAYKKQEFGQIARQSRVVLDNTTLQELQDRRRTKSSPKWLMNTDNSRHFLNDYWIQMDNMISVNSPPKYQWRKSCFGMFGCGKAPISTLPSSKYNVQ